MGAAARKMRAKAQALLKDSFEESGECLSAAGLYDDMYAVDAAGPGVGGPQRPVADEL